MGPAGIETRVVIREWDRRGFKRGSSSESGTGGDLDEGRHQRVGPAECRVSSSESGTGGDLDEGRHQRVGPTGI